MLIREAVQTDAKEIEDIYLQAFDASEAQLVANLAIALLDEQYPVNTLSLVADINNNLVGHIAFSPVVLEESDLHFGYILAPLAVSPNFQNTRVGSSLINHGLDSISRSGEFVVFVYGDSQFYSRFGFKVDQAKNFIPPCTLQYPEGWQLLNLNSSVMPHGGKIHCVESLNQPELW